MPYYRRYFIPDRLVFITCVTDQRKPLFKNPSDLPLFWDSMRQVQKLHPFHLLAYVILPDHFHWLMQLPEDRPNFSVVMHSIKWNITRNYKGLHGIHGSFHLWQKRYWDHIIRDENDLERHFDYIHWNPVKHGYVENPEDWSESTFRHWIGKGMYPSGWGCSDEPRNIRGYSVE